MVPSQQALQLMHGSLQGIGPLSLPAGAVSCALRVLGTIEYSTGHLGSQIRSFGDAAPLATDRQATAGIDNVHQAVSSSAGATASTAAGAAADDSAAAGAQHTHRHHNALTAGKGELLKLAGLWVPPTVYKSLSQQQKEQIVQWQRQYTNAIGKQPGSSHMSAMSLNTHQLQVVVALTTDSSSNSSSSSHPEALQDSDSSSSSLPTLKWRQDRAQEQQQQHRKQQQSERQRMAQSVSLGFDYITSPKLDGQSLVKLSSEPLIINLNTQLRNAAAAKDPASIVNLFDSLIAKGIAEAQAAAAAAAQDEAQAGAQQQEQQEQQQQPELQQLVLPAQYRPDHDALSAYCRALCALEQQQTKASPGWEDKYSTTPQASCSVGRAEQAAALWSSPSINGAGLPVYAALLTAYRSAGKFKQTVEVFNLLREANPVNVKQYKVYLTALQAAVAGQDFDAANEIARAFSSKQIKYTATDYKVRLVYLYRALVRGAAALGRWEEAIYWLQEIINHDDYIVVTPINFLYVMKEAAAQRRMDVVRTMMHAVDQHLATQGSEPLVYYEQELCYIIQAAGAVGDTAVVDAAWQRLLKDMNGKPNRMAITQSAAGAVSTGGLSSTPRAPGHPGPVAYGTIIRAYVESKQYGKALKYIAEMEEVYKGTLAASVYGGLHFFPTALEREEDIAAAFAALQQRKNAGEPVTTTMMNVIARAIGRLGNTETTGKVFEGYGGWGLAPDADSYNTLIESCKLSKRVTAIESLISYMSSKGVEPNSVSYNLLLAAAVKADDRRAAVSALQRMLQGGFSITSNNARMTMNYAHQIRDDVLRRLMREANEKQRLGLPASLLWATSKTDGSGEGVVQARWQREQQQPRQERRPAAADVWKPNTQRSNSSSEQQQQDGRQQQQQSKSALDGMFDRGSSDDSEAANTLRAGLRAALGGNGEDK